MAGEMGWRQITEPNKSPITVYSMYQTLKLFKNKLLIKVLDARQIKFIFSLVNNREPLRFLDKRMTYIKQN